MNTIEIKGIDVSKYQGIIDWNKVKSSGIKFVMIRIGIGSYNGKTCRKDEYFDRNVTEAYKAGIHIGCYFYSYALSVEAVKKEAEFVINAISAHKGKLSYPVVYDLEDNIQIGIGKKILTDMIFAFGNTIEKAGYYFMLYSNPSWLKYNLDENRLKRFDLWLAQWTAKPTYSGNYGIWQSGVGRVPGIEGNVDIDTAYKDYENIIKSKKLNWYTEQVQIIPDTHKIKPGDIIRIVGDKYYNGVPIPQWVKNKRWTVDEVFSDRVLINKDENGTGRLNSSIRISDVSAYISNETSTKNIKAGDIVKIVGTTYYTGAIMPEWVRNKEWIVSAVCGDRIVVNKSTDGQSAINSAVRMNDIMIVKGST